MSASELGRRLPRVLQRRFESLGGYVRGIVDEERERLGADAREISPSKMEAIQVAAFIYILDEFLREGTRAARRAVGVFGSLNADGFVVGSEIFTETSEATMRGERLADGVKNTMTETELLQLVVGAKSMRTLVTSLVRRALRDR